MIHAKRSNKAGRYIRNMNSGERQISLFSFWLCLCVTLKIIFTISDLQFLLQKISVPTQVVLKFKWDELCKMSA